MSNPDATDPESQKSLPYIVNSTDDGSETYTEPVQSTDTAGTVLSWGLEKWLLVMIYFILM